MNAIASAERELVIISPYLLPGQEYLRRLIDATQRGVKISILTNSLASTEVVLVHGAYRLEWRRGEIAWLRADGSVITPEPGASLLQRIGSRVSSWLPLEHLL